MRGNLVRKVYANDKVSRKVCLPTISTENQMFLNEARWDETKKYREIMNTAGKN